MIQPGTMASPADEDPSMRAAEVEKDTALATRIETALAGVEALATELSGQPEALLALLRQIESLHRRIQDGPFRSSLPADRNHLFNLLKGMEKSGGWPYIPRLQLRTFMDLLQGEDPAERHPLAA
jgi:hypothetical protein